MNIWFIVILLLFMFELGITVSKNGERKEGHYNLRSTIIGQLFLLSLIYMAMSKGI